MSVFLLGIRLWHSVCVCFIPFAILLYLENGRLEEGHICIKLCFKLGKNGTETF